MIASVPKTTPTLGLVLYSVAVTFASGAGAFAVTVASNCVRGSCAAGELLGVTAWGIFVFGPAALFFLLGVALVAGFLNRPSWWVGLLSGLIPAIILEHLLGLLFSEIWTAVAVIAWSSISGVLLMRVMRRRLTPDVPR